MSQEKKRPKALEYQPQVVTDVTIGLTAFNVVVSIASAVAATAVAMTGAGLIVLGVAAAVSVITVGALRGYRYYKDRKLRVEQEQALKKKQEQECDAEQSAQRSVLESIQESRLFALQRKLRQNASMSKQDMKESLQMVQRALLAQEEALTEALPPRPKSTTLGDYVDLSRTEIAMSMVTHFLYYLSNAILVGNFSLNVALATGLTIFAAGTLTVGAGIVFGVAGGVALLAGIGYSLYALRKQFLLAAKLEKEHATQLQTVNDWLVEKLCDDQLENNIELLNAMCLNLHTEKSFLDTLLSLNHVEDKHHLVDALTSRAQSLGLSTKNLAPALDKLIEQHDRALRTLQTQLNELFLQEVASTQDSEATFLINQLLRFPGATIEEKLHAVFFGPPQMPGDESDQNRALLNKHIVQAADRMALSGMPSSEKEVSFASSMWNQIWVSISGAKLVAGLVIGFVALVSMALLLNPMTVGIVVGVAVVGGAVALIGHHVRKRNQEKLLSEHLKREQFMTDLTATMAWTDKQMHQAKSLSAAEKTVGECLERLEKDDYDASLLGEKILSIPCSESSSRSYARLRADEKDKIADPPDITKREEKTYGSLFILKDETVEKEQDPPSENKTSGPKV